MQPCLQHFVPGCVTFGAFGAAPNPPLATTRPCAPSVDASITCWAIVNLGNVIRPERRSAQTPSVSVASDGICSRVVGAERFGLVGQAVMVPTREW